VTRNTGFARGLFDATETDSGKVKDKESKTAWLAKIIACVGLALNEKVTARPLKIVAGLEPEHTNAFLQQLARAAKTGDSSEAVRRALAGETPAAAPAKQTHRDPSPPPREPSPGPPPPPPPPPPPGPPPPPPPGTLPATTTPAPTRTREVTLARARVRAATAAAQRLRR
jgi:TRAF3-interacting protein 1